MSKERIYDHKGWEIKGVGGFCTIRHFWAIKEDKRFHCYKLKEVKAVIDKVEAGQALEELIYPHQLEALYR